MISTPGELVITTRTGKYGNFNTAKLSTSIGEFTVRDRSLDQYESGKYEGNFIIKQIKSSSYTYANRVIIECCAYLDSMDLFNSSNLSTEELGQNNNTEDPIMMDNPIIEKENSVQNPTDQELFGILWPLTESVKLDSTVDRLTIRTQKNRLIELGYCFDFKKQIWNKALAQF